MSWLLSQSVAAVAWPRRVCLPLGFSPTINSDLVQATWGRRVVAGGPSAHLDVDAGPGKLPRDGFRYRVAVIPPKANCARQIACDFAMDRWRLRVENFFCDLKQFRRIATHYDKTDQSFAAMIHPTPSLVTLN